MFTKAALNEIQTLIEQWQRNCSECYGKRPYVATTESGIPLKPTYFPTDIDSTNIKDIGIPGEYPYTRGSNPRGYEAHPFQMLSGFGYGGGEESRDRWEYLKSAGMRLHVGLEDDEEAFPYFNILTDIPTQQGYDPDDPEARGKVGDVGWTVSIMEDLEMMFKGLPLDKIAVTPVVFDNTLWCTALYVLYAEKRGYPSEVLNMWCPANTYRGWFQNDDSFPPDPALKLMVENIKYRINHMPRTKNHTNTCSYQMGEAGATPVQQLAFSLAFSIAIVEECVKAGLNAEDVLPGIYHKGHIGCDFFEEIAKFRAWRRMWATIAKERFQCKNPAAFKTTLFPQTGGVLAIAREPLNNIVRLTLGTLAGVLGGADGIWTVAYDEPLAIPSEQGHLIALRTQQIINHEVNISSVADQLGGSYFLEWLTNRVEEEAWKLIDKIDEIGGPFKAWETGWLKAQMNSNANAWSANIESGDRVIIGVNKYRLEEVEEQEIPLHEFDPKVEERAIERVRRFRAERDNSKTQESLLRLREAANRLVDGWPDSCGVLMPAIFDAVRTNATGGEVQRVLKEVYSYGNVV